MLAVWSHTLHSIFWNGLSNDLSVVVDELSALLDKKTLLRMYMEATEQRFSFLFIELTSATLGDIFMVNFNSKIMISLVSVAFFQK